MRAPRVIDLPVARPKYNDNQERSPGNQGPDSAEKNPPRRTPEDSDPSDEELPIFFDQPLPVDGNTVVYVVDRSSSMQRGISGLGQRWAIAQDETQNSIQGLSASFRFNVVVFDCSVMSWRPEPQKASVQNKKSAIEWLQNIYIGGSTGTAPAVISALSAEVDMLVLLTDGEPTCPAEGGSQPVDWMNWHRRKIRAANTYGTVIHVFGIDARDEYRAFCVGVASDNRGSFFSAP